MSIEKFIFVTNIVAENKAMEIAGYTISELAKRLGLPYRTVQKRLKRAGIEPITTGAIYPESALEAIRSVPGKGRPRKPPPDPEPEKPAKKGK